MKTINDLKKEIEERTEMEHTHHVNLLKERLEQTQSVLLLIETLKDPYPLDVFPGLENEDVAKVVDLIKDNLDISPDRFSAHLMRKARKNVIEDLKDAISGGSD